MREISLADVAGLVGQELGVSDWITVNQTMIDQFADATLDHQFIHVDPERAKAESPFGGTIAHGFLSLSLLSAMNYETMPKIREQTMGINYGFDKVRFMSPVKSGARVRGHFTLADSRFRGAGMLMTTYEVSIEIENEKKPALTATWITIVQFDPKDRPEDA
ncbi:MULTISPECIES: MaoC family dehydratase [Rhizobium/Agrobacterium group]|jgi:acyl dehydratase|uniref:MaoC family dehydratase n=1 Tax=Rhizobium/Agrobacterium group TaxID=227290 RepID=UPI0007148711|nr:MULTISPECIES: MaoC family dehydratase [Rhizobium/Agrobacterium group]RYE67345.1 MAG: MaoC family dehydratase [Rhizobiaceae bacterium]KQQ34437.1 Nodulation protein N [Rhizobium sp. Leaf306]MBD8651663.1 MaoC family dehydratase [Rhizobium sp. CFBP 13726]MBD8662135.1 MaoC family dehydratase [Rhizobium sp. CFBP 8752]MBP2462228.1 acyl dehydratase [Rhizobium sp. PvP014]